MQEKPLARSFDLLWLSLALLPLLVIACLLPLSPNDFWWYLRLGQDILSGGAVPLTDTYSILHSGDPIVYKSWLSSVIFWLMYSKGGIPFISLLQLLSIGTTYSLLWILVRKLGSGPRLATALVLMAGLCTSNNWAVRPQLLVYPLFACLLFLLWNWHFGFHRGLWLFPVLALLWANLHGSFPLAFVLGILALLLGRGDRKILFLVLTLSVLATFVNPYGPSLWKLAVTATARVNPGPEWSPPVNNGWQMNLFFGWLILLTPLAAFSSRRPSKLEWGWFLALTWLALTGLRYVIWDVLFLAVFTASLLSDWDRRWVDIPIRKGNPLLNVTIASLFLIFPLSLLPGIRDRWWPIPFPSLGRETPVAAVEWLSSHPDLPGPLWSDFVFSSYLIYALPSQPVVLDTRLEILYSADDIARYQHVASASLGWNEILSDDHIRLLMASVNGEPDLIRTLKDSTDWCEGYRDEVAVIFIREGAGLCP